MRSRRMRHDHEWTVKGVHEWTDKGVRHQTTEVRRSDLPLDQLPLNSQSREPSLSSSLFDDDDVQQHGEIGHGQQHDGESGHGQYREESGQTVVVRGRLRTDSSLKRLDTDSSIKRLDTDTAASREWTWSAA